MSRPKEPVERVRVQAYLLPSQVARLEQIKEEDRLRSMSELVDKALRQFEASRSKPVVWASCRASPSGGR